MTIEIKTFSSDSKELLNDAVQLRFLVFNSEQGVDKDIIFDGLDFEAIHYLLLIDGNVAATARWRETDEGVKIERMAVKKEYRSLGIGFLLMKFILKELLSAHRVIYLHAQEQVVEFYKSLKFFKTSDSFSEANIIHYKMIYKA